MLLLVLFYTTLGGMISVVITDYIQFIVLSVGMLVACVSAVNHLGWTHILATVRDTYGEAGFNPFHGDGFGPSYVMWQIFVAGLVFCAIRQTAVIQACSAESTATVKRLYIRYAVLEWEMATLARIFRVARLAQSACKSS